MSTRLSPDEAAFANFIAPTDDMKRRAVTACYVLAGLGLVVFLAMVIAFSGVGF